MSTPARAPEDRADPTSDTTSGPTSDTTSDTTSATAHRLLEAAAEAFADRGFHATTTRDIASRAGLSPAGVYVHFSSKEELLYQLSREGHEAARDMLVAAAAGAGSPTEALRAIMGTFSRWHAEHFRVARIVQYEFGNLTPEHRDAVLALRKQIDAVVRDVVTAGVASGEFSVDDVPDTTLALMSMAVDVARWYDPEIKRTPAAIGDAYADLGIRLVTAR
ncbi:TetR/AcrR family transcriptional regulator [Phycicoccus sp. Soil748]|uniref:TetR/AcrR family transcriptional regulator n=1 Tax=Phycicoccus sp. Soil748 TaxID=1736397 RepID=UPI000702F3E1|nr:TetR/AcrR family transcriptional regulator [Phycicoccus sp. Soil748]KRE54085.1 TetR family transcriptional regulator [Phycicoccus sp. Soil748]